MAESPTGDEIHRVCEYLAGISDSLSQGAGTDGIGNAGTFVSVCACDPDFSAAVAKSGLSAIIDHPQQFNAMTNGCLSYEAASGEVLYPSEARKRHGVRDT